MPKSMTGFGRGESRSEHFIIRAEIRSVNNRNLRVVYRMPETLQSLENDFNNLLRDTITRGSVTVAFVLEDLTGDTGYTMDQKALQYYRDSLLGVDPTAEIHLADLAMLPGVVRRKAGDEVSEELAKTASIALNQAKDAMSVSRETEGNFIWQDMIGRCGTIRSHVDRIEAHVPAMVEEYSKRLSERLGKLLGNISAALTQDDLRKEIALFADRSDVSEEITRMRSHIELMESMGKSDAPIGRKLEFVTQEMFREANTMASKACESEMVHNALEIKAEVEKLREQSLNIE